MSEEADYQMQQKRAELENVRNASQKPQRKLPTISELDAILNDPTKREIVVNPDGSISSETLGTVARLQARIAELENADRWIPVSERLPEQPGHYLACSIHGHVHLTGFHAGRFGSSRELTHWRELPPGPGKEGA